MSKVKFRTIHDQTRDSLHSIMLLPLTLTVCSSQLYPSLTCNKVNALLESITLCSLDERKGFQCGNDSRKMKSVQFVDEALSFLGGIVRTDHNRETHPF